MDGTYKAKVTTPAGYIVDPVAAGDVVRTSATTGVSADVVLAGVDAVVNPLVRPDFVLQLGYLNNPDGIITGAAPFDTADPACVPDPGVPTVPTILNDTTTPPGVDCTPYDDNVRSADNVAFNFAIPGSADDDTVSSISDVVLRQTLTPTAGVIRQLRPHPIACVPPSGGSGGTPPPTSKVEYLAVDGITWVDYTRACKFVPQDLPVAAAGRPLRLTCNKGTYSTGDASTLGTTVRVDGTSPEGSKFQLRRVVRGRQRSRCPGRSGRPSGRTRDRDQGTSRVGLPQVRVLPPGLDHHRSRRCRPVGQRARFLHLLQRHDR